VQQKVVEKTTQKYRHERTKSDCPESFLKAESKGNLSKQMLTSAKEEILKEDQQYSKPQPKMNVNTKYGKIFTNNIETDSKHDLLTSPPSPSKKIQSQIKLHPQLMQLDNKISSNIQRDKLIRHDAVDEEQKVKCPHDGIQKMVGWHKRCASDGNTIAAKLEKMRANEGKTKQDDKKQYADLAIKKQTNIKDKSHDIIKKPESGQIIESRSNSKVDTYKQPSKIQSIIKDNPIKQIQGVKLCFDNSVSENMPTKDDNSSNDASTKYNKENNISEGKTSKYRLYEFLSKQNVVKKTEETKLNNFFPNQRGEQSCCESGQPHIHGNKKQEKTVISPHSQAPSVSAYNSNKKIPSSAIVTKGVPITQSPPEKDLISVQEKQIKVSATCIKSTNKYINSLKANDCTAKKANQEQQKIKEISPLSIENVEKLQHEGDIFNLIKKIGNRIF
jgi:hypothetical protein